MATGHYASIREIDGKYWLATAADAVKDQTDFLAQISYEQLSHLLFPLGEYPKSEVRLMAKEVNLPNASRKDSQGICFLGKINYSDFLERQLGSRPGPVIEIETGKKIGTHRGYWFYTIGQRKGLGLSGGPWFVVRKNVRDNVIYVSNGYDTRKQYGRHILVEEMHWITLSPFENKISFLEEEDPRKGFRISFKTRHAPEFFQGWIKRNEDGGYLVESDKDVQGIAPGQYVIIYTPDNSLCLGSGMISLPAKHHGRTE